MGAGQIPSRRIPAADPRLVGWPLDFDGTLACTYAPTAGPICASRIADTRLPWSISSLRTVRYRVLREDSLSRIAQNQLGDSRRWREIAALNGLSPPYGLLVGQNLRIPWVERVCSAPLQSHFSDAPLRPTIPNLSAGSFSMVVAKLTRFPPFKIDFDKMEAIRILSPGVEITLKLVGSIKVQEVGYLNFLTVSKDGVEVEYEEKAKYAFYEFAQGLKLKLTSDGIGVSWTYKSGTELAWTKVQVSLVPGGIKETVSPKPVNVQIGPFIINDERRGPFKIEGTLGFEITIKGTPTFYVTLAAGAVVVVALTLPEDAVIAAFAGGAEIVSEAATAVSISFQEAAQWLGASLSAM